MSRKAKEEPESGQTSPSKEKSPVGRVERFGVWVETVVRPWGEAIKVVTDPMTLALIAVAIGLGWYGARAPTPQSAQFNSALQIVLALVTGVIGARMAAAVVELRQEGKLFSSGRMAVRSLRLILSKTLALERRVAGFLDQSNQSALPEVATAVALRNLDEVLESIRTLQLEIAGSIENWVDLVPGTDVSTILVELGDLRDKLSQKDNELFAVRSERASLIEKGSQDGQALREANEKVTELEEERQSLRRKIGSLQSVAVKSVSPGEGSAAARKAALEQWRDQLMGTLRTDGSLSVPAGSGVIPLHVSLTKETHPLPK